MQHSLPFACLTLLLAGAVPAYAHNAACWGIGRDDLSRPDISCSSLTEAFLKSLHKATRAKVLKAMDAEGVVFAAAPNELHFVGNAGGGSEWTGNVTFTFEGGTVYIVDAVVDAPGGTPSDLRYLWNGKTDRSCSDFPGSRDRCNLSR